MAPSSVDHLTQPSRRLLSLGAACVDVIFWALCETGPHFQLVFSQFAFLLLQLQTLIFDR